MFVICIEKGVREGCIIFGVLCFSSLKCFLDVMLIGEESFCVVFNSLSNVFIFICIVLFLIRSLWGKVEEFIFGILIIVVCIRGSFTGEWMGFLGICCSFFSLDDFSIISSSVFDVFGELLEDGWICRRGGECEKLGKGFFT